LPPESYSTQNEQFERAFHLLAAGIEQRAFPGASVAVTHRGNLVALKGVGRYTYDPGSPQVSIETIYDLASVTKVVATTALCMALHERGLFHLDQKLVEILPEFRGEADNRRTQVTFRMILAHSSGLPAYVKLFERTTTPAQLMDEAMRTPLTADPGSRVEYSDIGFILLGKAIERIAGKPFEQLCREQIFSPLGLASLTFTPPPDWRPMIPPTVEDRSFRQTIMQGVVHDENAWVLCGIAGHAGCFSTARDVARFATCMLRGGDPVVNAATIELFTERQPLPAGTSRALGWDTPSHPSQSGRYFSPRSFGHLGYTGTSLWIDPERQLSVTLLTNRTWPDCGSQLIRQIRPAFHDAVVEALQ
jgi:CubicO group peptidase (beta-lactamase class C family)